jgi:hypothetical protein
MSETSEKVRIKHPIDPDSVSIQKDPFYPSAYIIALPLDSEPSYIWHRLFEQELWSSLDFWDRKVVIVGRELRLVTTRDRVGEKLGWLEELVTGTNKRVEEYNKKAKVERESKEVGRVEEDAIRTELSSWIVRRAGRTQ